MNAFDQYPVINPSTLAMLKKNTASTPFILTELFHSFIDDAGELITEIKSATSSGNNDSFYMSVHTLKGLCGTIGCSRLFEVLKVMDSFNKEKSFEMAKSKIAELDEVLRETVEVIRTEIEFR